MGEEFYCTLKLVSGEEVFSLISVDEGDDEPIIILQNPVIMKSVTNQTGTFLKIKPWIETSSDDIYIIKLDKVITMTESKDSMIIELYKKYVSSDDDTIDVYKPSGQVGVSSEMGYLTSVKKAREILEILFKDSKES